MAWALESVVTELADEIDKAGISINQKTMFMVTKELAIRLPYHHDTRFYRKLIKNEIDKVNQQQAAKIRARQTSLL